MTTKKDWCEYMGIEPLPDDRGYIPYELFDKVYPYIDNLAELKVVLFITRRTTAFKKKEDWIAKCQFEHGMYNTKTGEQLNPGAGLSRPSIDRGIKLAIEHGIIQERIACSLCGQELIRQSEVRIIAGKEVEQQRVPITCPKCGIGTQTKMKYFYRLVYKENGGT